MDTMRPTNALKISTRSVEILLDLVEIKLGSMEIEDRDVREIGNLKRCRDELMAIERFARSQPMPKRGPGRPRNEIYAAGAA